MRLDRVALAAGPAAVLLLMAWLAPVGEALVVLVLALPWVLGWLMAALGLGWPLRRWLVPDADAPLALQAGLGVAALLLLDATLGAVGLLQGVWAWVPVVAGAVLLTVQMRRDRPAMTVPPLVAWSVAPALAVLLVASASAPGWLWSTEFGGYDALSYHLQLPKEWLAAGRIEPFSHNVYSYLPGYVEAAYYHVAALIGDPVAAVYACQLLHAAMALLTAIVTATIAMRLAGPVAGLLAGALVIGTPWIVVVGSLGYNEMAVALMLATGLLLIDDPGRWTPGRGAAIGLVAAVACGAKLTGLGFAAVPLAVLTAAASRSRWYVALPAAAGAALIALSPWLIRNAIYGGNPFFPFIPQFGLAHWTQTQQDTWLRGHFVDADPLRRLITLWHQYLRFGLGANPDPTEPWRPQWLILPWLALVGLCVGLYAKTLRLRFVWLTVLLGIQIVFWLTFTHLKSRFLVPTVVPASLAAAIGLATLASRWPARHVVGVAAVVSLLWSFAPALIYLREREGEPEMWINFANVLTGEWLDETGREMIPEAYANFMLPPGSRVLMVGEAAPLYYLGPIHYTTTWDRSPLVDDEPPQGYTHLLINTRMLDVWDAAGWNDPRVTTMQAVNFAERHGTLEREFGPVLLYRLDR